METDVALSPARTAREKLLDAALTLVRTKGFTATSVDDLCRAAGVTKGAFFHHFKSKEELGIAAVHHWSDMTGALFAAAPYHAPEDPLERVLAYVDFRGELLSGALPDCTCFAGTLVQEMFATSPELRAAAEASISGHARTLESDIADAMERYGVGGGWTAESLALHTQAVLQGAFILAKAKNDPAVGVESVQHLRRYIELLFSRHPL